MTKDSRGELALEIKSINDVGKFTGVFSVFGNTDLDNERVMPGALDRSVKALQLKGMPIPVLFGHDQRAVIGSIRPTDIRTSKTHAEADGQLDLSEPLGRETHTMMRKGLLGKFSFGYVERVSRPGADGVRELHDLDLKEVSVTIQPANPATELLSVKADKGTKVYIDAELEGSFEDAIDDVRDAVMAGFNPTSDPNICVCLEATYPDRALVSVQIAGAEEQHFSVPYTDNEDGPVTLGTPEAVDVNVTLTPTQGKAGRRLSKASEQQLNEIVAHYKAGLDMMNAFLGTAEDAPSGKSDTADVTPTDAEPEQLSDREPQAKSHDELFDRVSDELTNLQLLREKQP